MRQVLLSVFGSLCVVAVAPLANAGPRYEEVSTSVKYHDLDLGSPAGERELNRRLRRSIAELCKRERNYNGSRAYLPDGDCVRDALAATQTQVARALAQPVRVRTRASSRADRARRAIPPPARRAAD